MPISPEKTKFWHLSQFNNLELLHAHFVTHAFSRHSHDTYAIGIIQQGVEAFSYRGQNHFAPAGSIVIVHPGEAHTGYAGCETGWTYRMLYPDISILQQAITETIEGEGSIPYFPKAVIDDKYLMGLILRLHLALEDGSTQLEQESRMLWTMAQLVRRQASDRISLKPLTQESAAIRRVREYLDAYHAQNLTLEALTTVANLSQFYLLRTFRKQVGLPPHEYLNQVRIIRAKKLLFEGIPIAKVAHETGFADQSHLTRQFKRIVGVTPGEYQRARSFKTKEGRRIDYRQ